MHSLLYVNNYEKGTYKGHNSSIKNSEFKILYLIKNLLDIM